LIYQERPLLPVEKVRETLTGLRDLGLTLGVATGRPYQEIVTPLEQMNLLSLFDRDHFATHREVETAEAELRSVGIDAALSKPHPFLFLRALYPSLSAREIWEGHYPTEGHQEVAVVGDAVSDVVAAKAIGCYSISVLTGAGGSDQATALRDAGTDLILPDVTYLMRDA
jgi:phosphoglycolate phosphatase-like HAD superfamily hydrolase